MADPPRTADAAARPPRRALARVAANAGLLVFASLLVMTLASGRLAAALLWAGALLVFFAHALDTRWALAGRAADRVRLLDTLRWCGVACALAGAAALWI